VAQQQWISTRWIVYLVDLQGVHRCVTRTVVLELVGAKIMIIVLVLGAVKAV